MTRRQRLSVAGAVCAIGLIPDVAACGSSSSSTSGPTSASTGTTTTAPPVAAIHVRLTAPTHTPVANAPWHYVVRVTSAAGAPIPALIHLQALFQGQVVGQIGLHRTAHGVWAETIKWPNASVGQPLVFQVKATANGVTATVNYPLQVSRT
jgi:hypothetical protein